MLQRYKTFILFILVLNNISFREGINNPNMAADNKLKIGGNDPQFKVPDHNAKMIKRNFYP
jgi:hypothetical protein